MVTSTRYSTTPPSAISRLSSSAALSILSEAIWMALRAASDHDCVDAPTTLTTRVARGVARAAVMPEPRFAGPHPGTPVALRRLGGPRLRSMPASPLRDAGAARAPGGGRRQERLP